MDINLFNLRKMFSPDQMVGMNQPMDGMIQPQMNQSTYQPEHAATDQFNQLLNQYPVRENPSLMRKIGAALLNVGGQNGMAFLDKPNTDKIEDWKNRINPTLSAANLEIYSNANERQLATSVLNNQTANKRIDTNVDLGQQRINTTKDLGQQRIDTAKDQGQQRIDLTKQRIDEDGYIHDLTDSEKAALNQKNDLTKITAQNQGRLDVANTNNANDGWSVAEITDPNDPSKRITVRVNAAANKVEPLKLNDQQVAGLTKPGTKPPVTPNMQNIFNKTQETINALDEVFDPKTGKLRPEITMAVGKTRLLPTYMLPGTEGASAVAKIKRIKDILTLELMQQMKAESANGALGFGNMQLKELGLLESSASKLDPSLEESVLETEGKRIREKLMKVLQPADGFDPNKAVSPPVRMRIPSGQIKLIPADKVLEAEARGAVRIQ